MAVIKIIDAGPQSDGVQIGKAGEKVGLYGATPVVQESVAKAAGANPTKAEFDALIDSLAALGAISVAS